MKYPRRFQFILVGLGLFGLFGMFLGSSSLAVIMPQDVDAGTAIDKPRTAAAERLSWEQLPPAQQGVQLFAGDSLGPWMIADTSYFDKHGPVKWEAGVLSLGAGRPGTGVAAQFDVPTNRYELSFQARRCGGDDFFCGLTFPFNDQQATLILGGWGGAAVGISNINNFSAIENLSSRHFPFEQDRWYQFRFRVTPESIELWIDEQSIFEFEPDEMRFSIWWEQRPITPLGFASWNTAAEFRQLTLRKLVSENP